MTWKLTVRSADAPTATFCCPVDGYFDVRTRDDHADCPTCGAACPWSLDAAPIGRTPIVSAGSMGKSDARPHAGIMNTRSLAEGQRHSQWKAERRKYWEDVDRAHVKRIREGR